MCKKNQQNGHPISSVKCKAVALQARTGSEVSRKLRLPDFMTKAGPVWTGAENLAPTGIRSPDRPACSQSLHPLSFPVLSCAKCQGILK